jgi:mannose-6-phosphate isomerase-like protein (cupin superfamily)
VRKSGEEVHELDQFIRFEEGEGIVVLDREKHAVSDGFAVVIPAGTRHNVVNSGKTAALKLYSLYSLRNIKMESFTKRSRKPTRITIIILTVGRQ